MNKNNINQQPTPAKEKEEITRKEAIKKAGKYAALTAAATLIILSPAKAQTTSPPPPGSGW